MGGFTCYVPGCFSNSTRRKEYFIVQVFNQRECKKAVGKGDKSARQSRPFFQSSSPLMDIESVARTQCKRTLSSACQTTDFFNFNFWQNVKYECILNKLIWIYCIMKYGWYINIEHSDSVLLCFILYAVHILQEIHNRNSFVFGWGICIVIYVLSQIKHLWHILLF